MSLQALQGFRDFYPPDFAIRQHIFDAWRRVACRYGFEEYDGPPLEPLELYTKKSGDEIVGQLYNFKDKGEREVALRPEMTPTVARMVAARAPSLVKPIKWFSMPQLFRYERKQRGRLREHFQLNMDIIGSHEVEADVELLEAALDIMRELGLTEDDVHAKVNDRRLVTSVFESLEVPESSRAAVLPAIDKFHKIPRETFFALLSGAGLHEAQQKALEGLLSGDGAALDSSGKKLRPEEVLEPYLALLRSDGFGDFVEVDFSIVRGLAYYTGIVFELYDRKGELRAICGGGRYDQLISSLGGPDLPALGFGMGDVVLGELLKDRSLVPARPGRVDVVVIPVGAALKMAAREVVSVLRKAGIRSETPYKPQGVGKDIKAADQAGAACVLIVGPAEWEKGAVKLKELASGAERTVPKNEIVETLQRKKS